MSLVNFWEIKRFFSLEQNSSRRGSNTCTAAIELRNFVYDKIDKRQVKVVSGLFLDLKKTFNTIEHGLMLSKLCNYGVRGVCHALYVEIDGIKIALRPIVYRLPFSGFHQ